MAIKITNTKDVINDGVKAIVYGKAGIGKTTLMATMDNQLILSAESGLLALADEDIDVIEINNLQDIYDAFDFINESEDAKKYESIGIDSITEIAEVCLSTYKKLNKDPRKSYGDLATDMTDLIRQFRDIKGKNVVFAAKHSRVVDEDSSVVTYMPLMPGKTLLNGMPFFPDEVFYMTLMENEEGEEFRVLKTKPGFGYEAKDRSGKLQPIEEPHLQKIFNKIKGV